MVLSVRKRLKLLFIELFLGLSQAVHLFRTIQKPRGQTNNRETKEEIKGTARRGEEEGR